MSRVWICVFFLMAITRSAYGGLGSVVSPSCPIKCDVFVEVQALRQMVNQESLIRMGIDAQTQELRKTVADLMTKLLQINSSLESTSSSQQTRLGEGISKVTKRLEALNRSDLDLDTQIELVNSSMRTLVTDVITKLQQVNSSLESNLKSQQASVKGGISKVTKRLEEINISVLDADTRIERVNSSLKQALTRVERDVQTLKQPSEKVQGILKIHNSNLTSVLTYM